MKADLSDAVTNQGVLAINKNRKDSKELEHLTKSWDYANVTHTWLTGAVWYQEARNVESQKNLWVIVY